MRKQSDLYAAPKSWSLQEFGIFYSDCRAEFVGYARRSLGDVGRAEELVQDAYIRFMLAAPELSSKEHARAYMFRTIDSLCIDTFRLESRRPNLVALDENIYESSTSSSYVDDLSHALEIADDMALVRQALSFLSAAERSALIMWDMENRSTQDIASTLGLKEKSVRHTVLRARRSLRRILSEMIIDERRGITALDLMSSSYAKAAKVAKKSSKLALSIIVVATIATIGFGPFDLQSSLHSYRESNFSVIRSEEVSSREFLGGKSVVNQLDGSSMTSKFPREKNTRETPKKVQLSELPGTDDLGVPKGFTVSDSSFAIGEASLIIRPSMEENLKQVFKTENGAANILISQDLTWNSKIPNLQLAISYGRAGEWVPLQSRLLSTDVERLVDGKFIISTQVEVESEVEPIISVKSPSRGRDLSAPPKKIEIRLMLDESRSSILAQTVNVVEKGF